MEFGILFTSHPNHVTEPYPHRDVHARVTAEIEAADSLGYDTAWVAEHHFSNQYGIMPDVFTYMGYLAARTSHCSSPCASSRTWRSSISCPADA
jgi:alkanesulfonate monooxygenase SsuD/methylene tetrahydromethanopterin reductase-like flavin-dependent oxidoreductase (luciferase family)